MNIALPPGFLTASYPVGYDWVTSLNYHIMYFCLFVHVLKALFLLCLNGLIDICVSMTVLYPF